MSQSTRPTPPSKPLSSQSPAFVPASTGAPVALLPSGDSPKLAATKQAVVANVTAATTPEEHDLSSTSTLTTTPNPSTNISSAGPTPGPTQPVAPTPTVPTPSTRLNHPLECKWAMWFTTSSVDSWVPRHIATVGTVEDFWCLYNNILPPSRIPIGSCYNFFKDGIKPMWEDEANAKGGKWSIELSKHEDPLTDDLWLWTVRFF